MLRSVASGELCDTIIASGFTIGVLASCASDAQDAQNASQNFC